MIDIVKIKQKLNGLRNPRPKIYAHLRKGYKRRVHSIGDDYVTIEKEGVNVRLSIEEVNKIEAWQKDKRIF